MREDARPVGDGREVEGLVPVQQRIHQPRELLPLLLIQRHAQAGSAPGEPRVEILHGVLRTRPAMKACTGMASMRAGCMASCWQKLAMRRACVGVNNFSEATPSACS